MSTAYRVIALVLVVLALAGCGKKAAPEPPPGSTVTYPYLPYPSQ